MKKIYVGLPIFILSSFILSCTKKDFKTVQEPTTTPFDNTFWVGAYGEKIAEAINYNRPITISLRNNNSVRIYTKLYDTTKSAIYDGAFKVVNDNVKITYFDQVTKENLLFTGKISEGNFNGEWSINGNSKGMFYIMLKK